MRNNCFTHQTNTIQSQLLINRVPSNVFEIINIEIYSSIRDMLDEEIDPIFTIISEDISNPNTGTYEYSIPILYEEGWYIDRINFRVNDGEDPVYLVNNFYVKNAFSSIENENLLSNRTTVYGYVNDVEGYPLQNQRIDIYLQKPEYFENGVVPNIKTTTRTDSQGYWEVSLLPSIYLDNNRYVFVFNKTKFSVVTVPNVSRIEFRELVKEYIQLEQTVIFNIYGYLELEQDIVIEIE